MIKKKSLNAAFTLIELLVVITIIGILAGIALPVFSQVQEKAQQTKSLASAKQIGLALKLFAGDNDGNFPYLKGDPSGAAAPAGAPADANEVFYCLFPTYCTAEKLFYTPKSAWCNKIAPDEVYNAIGKCLDGGENEYAYMQNLNDTSNAAYPLVFDGLSTDNLTYSADKAAKGGVWGGKKAVVIHVDTSGEVAGVDPALKAPYRLGADGTTKKSIFVADATAGAIWLDQTKNTILQPKTPVNP